MEEWRARYKTTEDEEKALAIALEQSLKEYEDSCSRLERRVHQDRSGREAELSSEKFPTRVKENHLRTTPATRTASASTGDERKAIPLCLPNNCKWNSQAREYTKTEEQRSSLYVVDEAIEKLREVKGPVCVVSIAGPYRKGKSYILSEAFDQPEVFPLGHEMVAETMGIWLWIVPEKYKDSRGQEFTVVLLDSEGIDAASSVGYDDNQIFTLTVLLASVLIYNSQGVPMRRDLEGLDFIAKLSQRIQVRSNQGVGVKQKETELFHRTFPYFLWLLRDVTQAIPRDCKDLKDYFLKKVFGDQDSASLSSSRHQSQQVAESILRYFSGFEAFHLPPPTAEEDIMRTLNENRSQVRPQFFAKLEEFKTLLKSTLLPKHSCFDGQLVTGEGLAALTTLYVEAINTPGSVPNVQSAWETFVETKCIDARNVAVDIYNSRMREVLSSKLPCDNDEMRKVHSDSLEECQRQFMAETTGISTITTEKYLRLLKQSLIQKLTEWQTENTRLTKELCNNLLSKLKLQHLGPILHQLQGHGGSNLSFDDIIGVYHRIKDDYEGQAVGAKDVIAAAFFDFQPELARETKQYLEILRQMKHFDEKAAQEMRVKAYQERERKRLEEQQLRLQQENQEHKKEMEMLITRLEKERVQYRQQMHSELEAQRVQMQNMMAANMKQAEQEREAFIKDNQALEERFLEVQRSNEENMKLIRNMTALIARQHKEKEVLREDAKELSRDKMEGLLNEMSERHTDEVRVLLKETDDQFEGAKKLKQETSDEEDENTCHKNLDEVPEMIKLRSEAVEDVQKKITETHQEQEEVETSSYIKKGLKVIARTAVPIGQVISFFQPETAPFAVPASAAIGTAAEALSNECSIM